MAVRRVDYLVGFTADKSQLDYLVRDALLSLSKLSNIDVTKNLTTGLTQAALAARELQSHMAEALNPKTGKLDLSRLEASLKSSGTSLTKYGETLGKIGTDGQEAFLKVASAVAKADAPLLRTNDLMTKLWTTMKNTVRWRLTTGALNSFIGGIETAYGYTKNLNESLNSIRIVTKSSTELMAAFAQQANAAAKSLSTTTVKYSDASLIYYQLGNL